jgi:antitoxin ParD1/3/4
MDMMNYAVPDSLKDFVLERVAEGGFSNVSEYVGELIRADQIQNARAVLEAEVLKGIRSPKAPMTEGDWAELKARIGRQAQKSN